MIAFVPTILAEAAQPQGIAALGIDPVAILAQAVTFLVFFWVIKKFALGKIVNTLESRRKTIDDGVLLGIEMQKEKTELDQRVEEMLHKARLEADKIIDGSKEEANQIIKAAESTATKKAADVMQDAQNRIGEEIDKAKQELKKDMVHLVSVATEAIIDEKVDAKKDASLIERALASMGRGAR